MKKLLAILFSISLVAGGLTACGQTEKEPETSQPPTETAEPTEPTEPAETTQTPAKTGLAVITTLAK